MRTMVNVLNMEAEKEYTSCKLKNKAEFFKKEMGRANAHC